MHDITQLLLEWEAGEAEALNRLMPLVYENLRRLAGRCLARERSGHVLQPTALVHETYVKLVDQKRVQWQSRVQFYAVAASMMRRILVDHARKSHAAKRGGGAMTLSLADVVEMPELREVDLVALDDALQVLESLEPRQSRVVELRFFAGLKIDETASALGVSPATVKVDWSMARAWLFRELNKS